MIGRPSSHKAATAGRALRIGVQLVLGVSLLVVAARYTDRVFDLSRKDYGEGPILAMVERMGREPVSAAWMQGPEYTLSCYGPGYYGSVLMATAVTPWQHSLVPGRLVALAATLATAGLIAWAVSRKIGSLQIGLLSALIYLVSSVVSSWVPYQRVDTLAVLFGVGAYLAADATRRGFVLSAMLVAVGSLVKQTVALSAVPILIHLILGKRYRDAAAYAILVSLLGGGLWGAVDWLSGGYFLTAAIQANLNETSIWHGLRLACGFLQCPTVLVAVLVVGWLAKNEPRKVGGSLYCVGFVLSSLIAVVAVSKEGASINYFLEPCALAVIVVGMHGAPRIWPAHAGRVSVGLGLLGLVLIVLVLIVPGVGDFPGTARPERRPGMDHARLQKLLKGPRQTPVLADGRWIDAALSAGRRPLVNDPFLFRLLVDNGALEARGLVDALERGEVRLLLLSRSIEDHRQAIGRDFQRWPAEVLDAMQRHYALVAEEGGLCVYRHRGSAVHAAGSH